MPLYDIFKAEDGGVHPFRHIARTEFTCLNQVADYCRVHRLRFLPAETTDQILQEMRGPVAGQIQSQAASTALASAPAPSTPMSSPSSSPTTLPGPVASASGEPEIITQFLYYHP